MPFFEMIEQQLSWISHWLPIVQGFAALASIAGATLSWRYAIRAQKAQEQMTENVVTSRLLESLDGLLQALDAFLASAIQDGKPDPDAFKKAFPNNKGLLERSVALCSAAEFYIRKKPANWGDLLSKLNEGAREPNQHAMNEIARIARLVAEELRLSALAREMSPRQ